MVAKNLLPKSASATSAVAHTIHINFPPAFGVGTLSQLIELSVKSIQTYRSRSPHKLPPACSLPDARNPVWLLTDVLDFLANHREPAPALPPPSKPRATPAPNSLRRRPTLVEAEAARAAGYTGPGAVAAHRAALRAAAQVQEWGAV